MTKIRSVKVQILLLALILSGVIVFSDFSGYVSAEVPTVSSVEAPSVTRTWSNVSLLYQDQFHNSSQVQEEIDNIHTQVPEIVDLSVIGQSYLGKNISVLCITNELSTEQKTKVFIVALHHAREQITIELALRFILRLVNGYGVDSEITDFVDTEEIYIIPALNPDGLDIVVNDGDHFLRKNLRPYDDDGDGLFDEDSAEDVNGDGWISSYETYTKPADFMYPVNITYEGFDNDEDGLINEDPIGLVDLNRNYLTGWGNDDASSSDPLSQVYRGEYAFSEPETQVLRDFVSQHKFAMAYSLHSGINTTYFPTYNSGNFVEPTLYWNVLSDYQDILPSSYNEIYGYIPYKTQKLDAALAGMWAGWMYMEQDTPLPICFEVYHNGSADTGVSYTVIDENATHITYDWTGIYPYFDPVEEYIEDLWIELSPAFDYLLQTVPRIDVDVVPASVTSTKLRLNLSITCLSERLDTVEDIEILASNGSVLNTISVIDEAETIEVQRALTFLEGLPDTSFTIRIGNNYTGYAEFLVEPAVATTSVSTSPTSSSVTTSTTSTTYTTSTTPTTPTPTPGFLTTELVLGITAVGIVAIVIIVVILKRKS
ncbi:MAG: M14 family zinc carboxypeptidase [Candidatus Thorarchaeota archaeon]